MYIRKYLADPVGPAMTSHLAKTSEDPSHGVRIRRSQREDGSVVFVVHDVSDWCLVTAEGPLRLQWDPPPCNAAWRLEPPVPEITLDAPPWHLPAPADYKAGHTCMEMRALGPDAMLAAGPFEVLRATGMVINWMATRYVHFMDQSDKKTRDDYFGPGSLWGLGSLFFFLCVTWGVPLAGVCGLALTLLSVPVFFALLPVALKLQLYGADRAIAFCAGEVGFTAAGLPFFLFKTCLKINKIRKGYQDPQKPDSGMTWPILRLLGLPLTVQGQWCFEQTTDAFIDAASLLSMAGRVPHFYTVCWALTVASSWTQAILLRRGKITYEQSMCMGLLTEDPWQLAILMRMFAFREVTEFMMYSFIEASLGCLFELRVVHGWWRRRHSPRDASQCPAGHRLERLEAPTDAFITCDLCGGVVTTQI